MRQSVPLPALTGSRIVWLLVWAAVAALVVLQLAPRSKVRENSRVLDMEEEGEDEDFNGGPPDPLQMLQRQGIKYDLVPIRAPSQILLPSASQSLSYPSSSVAEQEPEQLLVPASEPTSLSYRAEDLQKRLWQNPPSHGYGPCVEPSDSYKRASGRRTRGFLTVHANGGLNQMRAGICDMVAVARILNATLVVPELDKSSFWQDSSNFSDVFDTDHFISALAGDVPVVRRLPRELKLAELKRVHFTSWAPLTYYSKEIGRYWRQYKVLRALKTDSRLANNGLPADIQKLRCRVHFEALRFAPHIQAFGEELVRRVRKAGPYVALHLRYEKDMLAFSGCSHGLSQAQADELTATRRATKQWRVKDINAAEQRAQGSCPMTPREVGVLLSALGFPNHTRLYIAAGEIYGGEDTMKDLRARFPFIERKETLATAEELAPLAAHQNAMAAVDYLVSVQADVFLATYSGNMARAVEGHRRFLGHKRTISPDKKGLVQLIDRLDRGELQEGPAFSELVCLLHMHRQGAPRHRKGPLPGVKKKDRHRSEESFYANPLPDCLCQAKPERLGGRAILFRERGKRGPSVPFSPWGTALWPAGTLGPLPPMGNGPLASQDPRSPFPHGERPSGQHGTLGPLPPMGNGPLASRDPRSPSPHGERPSGQPGPSVPFPPWGTALWPAGTLGPLPPMGNGPLVGRDPRSPSPHGERPSGQPGPSVLFPSWERHGDVPSVDTRPCTDIPANCNQ
ncbi:unnamed protein product [Closterium sp. NIES-53]